MNGLTSVLGGVWVWVWTEKPSDLEPFTGAIVRAANGEGHTSPVGFDFRLNYQGWQRSTTKPLIAWTFLYPTSDGATAGKMLAAVDAAGYIIDWEDVSGKAASGAQLAECIKAIRQARPGRPVGFSSYPTAQQCHDHGIDWEAGISMCDFVSPQMYFGSQVAHYDDILADAGGRYVQLDVAPRDYQFWPDHAAVHLRGGEGVSVWRLGVLTAADRLKAAQLLEASGMGFDAASEKFLTDLQDNQTRMLDHGDPKVPGHNWHHQALGTALANSHNAIISTLGLLVEKVDQLAATVDQLAAGGGAAPEAAAVVTEMGNRLRIPVVSMVPPAVPGPGTTSGAAAPTDES